MTELAPLNAQKPGTVVRLTRGTYAGQLAAVESQVWTRGYTCVYVWGKRKLLYRGVDWQPVEVVELPIDLAVEVLKRERAIQGTARA